MHNSENKCCKPMIRKYRACVSLSGNLVDVLDVHDKIVATFALSIKFGKVALEEKISHSLIVIPVDGDAESFSPFEYDYDSNSISTVIMKTDGTSQKFCATLEDLMALDTYVFTSKKKCDHHNDKFNDKCDKHCHCGDVNFKPSDKPLVDPYVTRSELLEEAKIRRQNDIEIRDMIGESKNDNISVCGQIEKLSSALHDEINRSKFEDKCAKERLDLMSDEFAVHKRQAGLNDAEVRKMITKESEVRGDACSELYRLVNLLQSDDLSLRAKIDETYKEIRKEGSISRSSDRDLQSAINREEEERIAGDKNLNNLIKIEETKRFEAVKGVNDNVEIETKRAKIAEEEIRQDIHRHVDAAKHKDAELLKKIEECDKKYQPIGEYVTLESKGIVLENANGLHIQGDSGDVEVVKLTQDDAIVVGDENVELKLRGTLGSQLTYNGEEVVLKKDLPTDHATQESVSKLQEQIQDLQEQLQTQIGMCNELEKKYDTLKDWIYAVEQLVKSN